MADRIRGITIEIDGNTTKLSQALSGVNKDLKDTQSALKDVNKLLKLDGGNVDLLKQKQSNLTTAIKDTESRLKTEREALAQLKTADSTPEVQKQMEALERQIAEDEQQLKSLKKEFKDFGSVTQQQVKAVGEKLKEVGEKIKQTGDKIKTVGTSLTKVTAPLTLIGAAGVKSFAEVDKTMTLTEKTMGATEEEARLLSDAMKEAAANSTFGMSDAATASLNFARAGLTAAEAANALAPAMNLAAGEGGDLDTVSGGLVATINGFAGSFNETTRYADVFANACNNSALDVNSLSESMSIAAPIFSAAGYTVEDAALYLGVLADNGIDANKGATSLKTGLARLVSPAKEGAEKMKQLGISVTNADGSMKDSVTIQKELHDAFAGLSESEQIAAASAIFGKNQMAPWLALINSAPDDVQALSDKIAVQGTTTEMAEAMMGGFGGSLEKLKSSIDVAVTSIGEALAPTIQKISDIVQKAVDWFNSLDADQQQMIATIGLVVAAVGPVLVVVGSVISGIGSIVSGVGGLISAMSFLAGPIGIVVAAIAAAIAVGVLLYKNWDKICEWAKKLKEDVVKAWEDLKQGVSDAVNSVKEAVTEKWNAMTTAVSNKVEEIKGAISDKWTAAKETVTNVMDTIKGNVSDRLDSIKTAYDEAGGGIKGIMAGAMQGIKDNWTEAFNTLDTLTGGKLSDIKDKFTEKFDSIKEFVSGVVEKLKNIFDFSWNLPSIPLPHFSWSWNDLGMISIPNISVEWYKKAYDQPYLFTSPTVVGGRGFGDGGGSGEIVYGRDQLMRDIAAVTAGETTINVYATPGINVNELADQIQARLAQLQRQKEAAFA